MQIAPPYGTLGDVQEKGYEALSPHSLFIYARIFLFSLKSFSDLLLVWMWVLNDMFQPKHLICWVK